jgi:hypothetical protein
MHARLRRSLALGALACLALLLLLRSRGPNAPEERPADPAAPAPEPPTTPSLPEETRTATRGSVTTGTGGEADPARGLGAFIHSEEAWLEGVEVRLNELDGLKATVARCTSGGGMGYVRCPLGTLFPAGRYEIVASHPGFLSDVRRVDLDGKVVGMKWVSLRLIRDQPARGIVVDSESGLPVEGAWLSLCEQGSSSSTDRDGQFEISPLEPPFPTDTSPRPGRRQSADFCVHHPDYQPLRSSVQDCVPRCRLSLQPLGGRLRLEVTGVAGPLEGATVWSTEHKSKIRIGRTGPDGVLEVPAPEGETAEPVWVEAPGHAGRVCWAKDESELYLGSCRLVPGAPLDGQVKDDSGDPVGGARIEAECSKDGLLGLHQVLASDASGRFLIEAVPNPGSCVLQISAPGLLAANIKEPAPAGRHTYVLSGGGRLKVQVVDGRSGLPVDKFSWIHRGSSSFGADVVFDESGTFEVGPLEEGSHRISIRAPAYQEQEAEVLIGPNQRRSLNIVMAVGAEATIKPSGGGPMPGWAYLRALADSRHFESKLYPAGALFSGLAPGLYELTWMEEHQAGGSKPTVRALSLPLVIELAPGANDLEPEVIWRNAE